MPLLLPNHNGGDRDGWLWARSPWLPPEQLLPVSEQTVSTLHARNLTKGERRDKSERCHPGGLHESQAGLASGCNVEWLGKKIPWETHRMGKERSSEMPLSNAQSPCRGVLPELVSFLFLRCLFQIQCGGNNKD